MAFGVLDDASMVGEGDDVAAGDDVVSGDQGCAVAVRYELSLVGADGAYLFDVLDPQVEPGWDCGHHGTAVEDRGGIVRACCDVLRVSLSADVVVVRLLVILLWRRQGG